VERERLPAKRERERERPQQAKERERLQASANKLTPFRRWSRPLVRLDGSVCKQAKERERLQASKGAGATASKWSGSDCKHGKAKGLFKAKPEDLVRGISKPIDGRWSHHTPYHTGSSDISDLLNAMAIII